MEQKEGPSRQNDGAIPAVEDKTAGIIYYTDPLCCWSWSMEPALRRLQDEHGGALKITYKMGGLLPSWTLFNDNMHSIRKPVHMGPEWMHARNVSGVFNNDRIWISDPPMSSFPACIAVKSAELQGAGYGASYLWLARKAVMADGKNIARLDVLLELADALESGFDRELFRADVGTRGVDAFKDDWKEIKYRGINRFPTLLIQADGRAATMLCGYQSYEALKQAIAG